MLEPHRPPVARAPGRPLTRGSVPVAVAMYVVIALLVAMVLLLMWVSGGGGESTPAVAPQTTSATLSSDAGSWQKTSKP